jgi:hypothetical protein
MAYLCLSVTAGVLSGVEVSQPSDCPASSYIAASASSFSDLPTLISIFTVPVAEDLQQMWMTGFALPIICYLTAWAYQSLISWFEKGEHH